MRGAMYKALADGRYVAYDPREGTYLVVGAEHVPPLAPLRLSQAAAPAPGPKGDGGRKARALLLMAMLEFQRRAHRVGMPDAAQPYLDHLAKLAADPTAAKKAIRLSWRAEAYTDGRQHRWQFKAIGEGPDAGRVLYGAEAQRAIERQQQRGAEAEATDERTAAAVGAPKPEPGRHPEKGYSHKDFQAKKAAAYKAASKVASLAVAREDITAAHLKEMAGHLPYLTVAQLRSVRARLNTAFDVSFGGKSRRAGMVESVMGHVRKELDRLDAEAGNPVVDPPKVAAEPGPTPEPAAPPGGVAVSKWAADKFPAVLPKLAGEKGTAADLASLAGALPGARASIDSVSENEDGTHAYVTVRGDGYTARRSVTRTPDGRLRVHNHRLDVPAGGKGVGTKVMAAQVAAARRLGAEAIETMPSGSDGDVGDKVLPKWGFEHDPATGRHVLDLRAGSAGLGRFEEYARGKERADAHAAAPPPKFEVSPGLSPEDAEIERKSQEHAHTNYAGIRDKYLKENATPDPAGGYKSIVVNTDEWRHHLPGYTGTNAGAVHEAASTLNKRLYTEALQSQKGKGNNSLLVLAGGGGSGKGTITRKFFDQAQFPLVLDQVSGNLKKLEEKLDEAKANGYTPVYAFVDRAPEAAAGGVVGRAMNLHANGQIPRTVNLDRAMTDNTHARKVALALIQKRPDVEPNIMTMEGGKPRLIEDRDEAIAFLKKNIAADAKAAAGGARDRVYDDVARRHAAGEIPKHIAEGLIGADELARRGYNSGGGNDGRTGVPRPGEVAPLDAAGAEPDEAANAGRLPPRLAPADAGPRGAADGRAAGGDGRVEAEDRALRPVDEDGYVAAAMANLKKTSRTAAGTVDTSASKGKADKIVEGLSGADAAKHATDNFERTIRSVYQRRNEKFTPESVGQFADDVNRSINKGIVKDGVLLRTDDSPKFPYTSVKHMDAARKQFAEEFAKRLNDPKADPVETAAWAEWRANLMDHVYADGVGKTGKALAALALMRGGMPLPEYRDNKEFFRYSSPTPYNPHDGGESYLDADWHRFLNFYRGLMPKGHERGAPHDRTLDEFTAHAAAKLPDSHWGSIPANRERNKDKFRATAASAHYAHVADALAAGKAVRPEVLKDHPELAPKPAAPQQAAGNSLDNGRTRDTLQEGSTGQGVSRGGLEQAGGADSGSGLRPQQPVGGEVASAPDANRPDAGEGTRGAAGRVSGGAGAALPGADVAVPGAGDDARRGPVGGAGGTAADAGEPDASVGDVGGRGRLVAGADQLPPVSRQEQSVAEPASPENPTDVVAGQNYRYPDREFFKGGLKAKFNANVEALKTLRTIQAEGRTQATPEEQAILARFTGWGQFPAVFDEYGAQGTSWEDRSEWAKERKVLKELLPADDWHAAARSTLNAHYTHPDIVDAHWQAAKQLGFGGGRFLETSAGVGYYLGMMPPEMAAKTKATAVELDPTTGGMLKLLYPKANTHIGGFETHEHPDNWFDVVASNVPFGDSRPYDPKYNKRRDYIHDYFFLKSAKQVRPGGLVMHITSTGTLDKLDPKVRQELAETCDLVSAMRFPGNAHLENAGTAVVTDMVILRKRHPGEAPGDRSWLETVDVPDPAGGKPITVNKYFADHPEQILGHLDRSGEMRAADQKNVSAISAEELSQHVGRPVRFAKRDDDDAGTAAATKKGSFLFEDGTRVPSEVVKEAAAKVFKEKLAAAIGRLPAGTFKPHTTPPERLGPKAHPAPGHVKRGGFHVADGKLYVKDEGVLKEREAKPADLPRIQGHLAVRDAWRAVVNAEMAGKDATAERAALNAVYDGFVKKFGPLHDKKNRAVFDTDPDSPVVLSLEKYDKKAKKVSKADIFSKQTIAAYAPATHAGSVEDGVGISLHEKGVVDPAHIAKLTGQPQEAVEKHLAEKGLAFRHPSEGWQRADQYLSGNVRQKLVMARAAAKSDPAYAANVAALEKVQPADIHHTHITPRLGAPWIPPSDVAAFAAFATGGAPDHFALHYNDATGEWKADYTKRGKWTQNSAKARNWQAGVTNKGFDHILEAALNGKMMRVYDGKGEDKVLNKDKTDALNAKIQELKDSFKSWVWDDAERRTRLHRYYNDNFNNIRVTQYDGSHLTMPGKAPDMEIRPHVKNFVWQVVTTGKALAGHEVGVGKTRAMIASAMELRRLGLARKPAIACLKANAESIADEARALYPGAKILSLAGNLSAAKRKQLTSQISSGDYDMVIMTHDHLNLMPMTPATVAKGIRAELDDLVAAKVAAEEAGNETQTKKLEGAQAKLEAKLKAATDERKKDDAVYFEETGIDHLFVDEAHEFKALPCYTQMEGMKGVPTRRSQKATNMLMRTKWLMEQNNGRGVVFATGTPISNSVGELYNMQRYLQPEELKARGINNFDAWVRTFAEPETKMEKKVTGDYGAVTRLAKFVNVPELLQMSRQVIDVRRADDIKKPDGSPAIKRPKRLDHFAAAENSPELDKFMGSLIERAKKMDPRDPTTDNMLSICTDGRKAAIDLRLINPKAADDPNSKVNLLVQNVLKLHKEDGDSTQAIFSDLGNHPVGASKHGEAQIPEEFEGDEDGADGFGDTAADRAAADAAVTGAGSGNDKFHLFGEIINKLVAGGIPRDQIADFTTLDGEAKEAAQQALREGRVKIALGGTKKLGTGVNIQDRLKHLHHLDAPWRPSDIEQRNGRGHRQGNKHEQVHVHTYVTKKSLDEFNWQVLASKAAFIGQAMTTDISGAPREFSEIDTTQLSPEHLMAVASGNPHMLEKIQVDEDVKGLEAARQRHAEEQRRLASDLRANQQAHANAVQQAAGHRKNVEEMDAAPKEVRIGDETFTEKSEPGIAAAALKAAVAAAPRRGNGTVIGKYRAFPIEVVPTRDSYGNVDGGVRVWMKTNNGGVQVNVDGDNPMGSLATMYRRIRDFAADSDAVVERARKNVDALQAEMGKPFPKADLHAKKLARQKELERLLMGDKGVDEDAAPHGAVDVGDDDQPDTPAPKKPEADPLFDDAPAASPALYHTYSKGGGWKAEPDAEPVTVPGIDGHEFFVAQDDEGNYRVHEARSGLTVGPAAPSKRGAVTKAEAAMAPHKAKLPSLIENAVKLSGPSPRNATITAVTNKRDAAA